MDGRIKLVTKVKRLDHLTKNTFNTLPLTSVQRHIIQICVWVGVCVCMFEYMWVRVFVRFLFDEGQKNLISDA